MIEIYFGGLICLESDYEEESDDPEYRQKKKHAKLIKDNDHRPFISINGKSPVTLTTDVTFSHLGEGLTPTSPLFDEHVPHLDDLTRPEIKLKKLNPGLTVHLPKGVKLMVAKFFKYPGRFTAPTEVVVESPAVCLPKLTLLTARPEGTDQPTINFNGEPFPLNDGDWILIANAPQKAPNPLGSHWKKHVKATTGGPNDIAGFREDDDAQTCGSAEEGPHTPDANKVYDKHSHPLLHSRKRHARAAGKDHRPKGDTHSECTNSQWP